MCNNPILYDILQLEIILTDTRYYYMMADAKKKKITFLISANSGQRQKSTSANTGQHHYGNRLVAYFY